MSTWNYRILTDEHHAGLYEVHYDDAGNVRARTSDSIVEGNDTDDLMGEVLNLVLALDLPALTMDDFHAAIDGTGEVISAGPRRSAAEQLAAVDRVAAKLKERVALRALQEVK